ncbi:MAG TPA: tetratricopeptide repeat protein, partial [bacterium]|nr:tetratricopeptide repeat protein [bacterium]
MADQKSLIIKLAHIYYHTGSWDKAIVEYQKIIALDPHDFNVRLTLGELFVKKGDLDRAYREFEAAAAGFLSEKNTKKAL